MNLNRLHFLLHFINLELFLNFYSFLFFFSLLLSILQFTFFFRKLFVDDFSFSFIFLLLQYLHQFVNFFILNFKLHVGYHVFIKRMVEGIYCFWINSQVASHSPRINLLFFFKKLPNYSAGIEIEFKENSPLGQIHSLFFKFHFEILQI